LLQGSVTFHCRHVIFVRHARRHRRVLLREDRRCRERRDGKQNGEYAKAG
jgi:hypothetical protein